PATISSSIISNDATEDRALKRPTPGMRAVMPNTLTAGGLVSAMAASPDQGPTNGALGKEANTSRNRLSMGSSIWSVNENGKSRAQLPRRFGWRSPRDDRSPDPWPA